MFYSPDIEKGIGCYVGADFSSGWAQADSDDAKISMSRMGYAITYAGCTVLWCSKLQTENTLSTPEAEMYRIETVNVRSNTLM